MGRTGRTLLGEKEYWQFTGSISVEDDLGKLDVFYPPDVMKFTLKHLMN